MLPLRDNIPSRSFPAVNVGLIITNVLVFLYQFSLSPEAELRLVQTHGLVPVNILSLGHYLEFGIVTTLLPLVTSMFLHGGWLHLAGNMLFLWIFGDNVEDRLGHFKFLLFYLTCGVFAGLLHVITHPLSDLPTLGASGAIAGVLGTYFVLFPNSRVLTLVPIFFFITTAELPAFILLGMWFIFEFISGIAEPISGSGGVAVWAHIGGFVAGYLFAKKWLIRYRYIVVYPGRRFMDF